MTVREQLEQPPVGPVVGEKVANNFDSIEPHPPEECVTRHEFRYFFCPKFSKYLDNCRPFRRRSASTKRDRGFVKIDLSKRIWVSNEAPSQSTGTPSKHY